MGRRRRAWLSHGTGKIAQRGNTLPGYYVEWCDYAGGRRIHRTKNFLKLRHARAFVARHNAMIDLQAIGEVQRVTIEEAAQEFGAGLSALRPQTRGNYKTVLGLLAGSLPNATATVICDISGRQVDDYLAGRLQTRSAATAAKDVRLLGRFFRWCIKRGYMADDPMDQVTTKPRGKFRRLRPHISDDQLEALLAAIDTEDRRIAVWIAITTGLDRGVIQRLTPAQVDLGQRLITVARPKTRRLVSVPIHPDLLPLLARRLAELPPRTHVLRGLARQDWHPTDPNRQEDWWKRACVKAGCPGLWFRDLRALASARAQRLGGLSLGDAQQLLGHASIQTTADHYLPPDPSIRSAIDKLPLPGHRQTSAGPSPGSEDGPSAS
jgi:integrase